MATRRYDVGRRGAAADRTRAAILTAAAGLLKAQGGPPSVGAIAARAGVSRLTVYDRFGSKGELMAAVAEAALAARPPAQAAGEPLAELRVHLAAACELWATDPALFRRLPEASGADSGHERALAERLAAADRLRPGCSLREAEDVIGALGSFAVFDRLHHDGRRQAAGVAEILMRMAAGILLT
jgi:AcrR family transcriptional regulator